MVRKYSVANTLISPSRPSGSSHAASATRTMLPTIRAANASTVDSTLTWRRYRASVTAALITTTAAIPMNSSTLDDLTPGRVWRR